MLKILQSRNIKRNTGAFIALSPVVLKYLLSVLNNKAGTDFEINEELLNMLLATGTTIWSAGAIHAYLPRIVRFTIRLAKALNVFNVWALKQIQKKK